LLSNLQVMIIWHSNIDYLTLMCKVIRTSYA